MGTSKPINPTKYIYNWKQQPVLLMDKSIIDYIDFSPIQPHNFAVTSSVRVQICNPITKNVTSTLSQFQKNAFGATFSNDGQNLVAGDDEGVIQLFKISTKIPLKRTYRGHSKGVHRTFFTIDKLHIASFSDDYSVCLWDTEGGECVQTYTEHTNYVRAGCVSPVSNNILLSGGYDGKVKMYDTRNKSFVFEVDHESPVNSVMFLPIGLFMSAGGTHINVWDTFSGGRLLARMSDHTKDVTCLQLDINGRQLLSGGMDRKVKIYDTATYKNVHSLDFPDGVFSIGLASNDETLAVGMADGIVSVQRMDSERQIKNPQKRKLPSNNISIIDENNENFKKMKKFEAENDIMLKKGKHNEALSEVFNDNFTNTSPDKTVHLIKEIIRRRCLNSFLLKQKNNFLVKFIDFLIKFMNDHKFMKTLITAANIFLDVYEDFTKLKSKVVKKFIELSWEVQKLNYQTIECSALLGMFEMILAGADVAEPSQDTVEYGREHNKMKPSNAAD